MFKYVWDFNEKDFEECKRKNDLDYVGNIRVGDLCFDIIQLEDEDSTLWIDCYVGGIDSGYGYGKDNYPYDYVCEVGTSMVRNEYKNLSYKQFVDIIEKELTESINCESKCNGAINFVDKANEPLRIW